MIFIFPFTLIWIHLGVANAQATFQRRINVVSTLWINVEITLIRQWKWNKIWCNVIARRWNNVETTLNRAIDDYGFVNRWIVFILLNDKIFSLTIHLLIKKLKNLLTVVHIVIHNSGKIVTYSEVWSIAFKNYKTYLKKRKYKINILHILKKTNLTAERKATILHNLILLKRYTYVQWVSA